MPKDISPKKDRSSTQRPSRRGTNLSSASSKNPRANSRQTAAAETKVSEEEAPFAFLAGTPQCPTTATTASPVRIHITDAERAEKHSLSSTTGLGISQMHTHGFVILENAICTRTIDALYGKMKTDALDKAADSHTIYNHGGVQPSNFGMSPPLTVADFHEAVYANPHAVAILEGMLGPRPKLAFISSNVEMPGGSTGNRQAVHSDSYGDAIPRFCYAVEMYIFLHDVDASNGSTETWPGSHVFTETSHTTNGRSYITPTAFTARAEVSPPIQPSIPKGSLAMRDLRLWHAGMPNTGSEPRIMLALIYFPQWWKCQMGLTLPHAIGDAIEVQKACARAALQGRRPGGLVGWDRIDLYSHTTWVNGPIDHLHLGVTINFTQERESTQGAWRAKVDAHNGVPRGTNYIVTKDNYWTAPSHAPGSGRGRRRNDLVALGSTAVDENGGDAQVNSEGNLDAKAIVFGRDCFSDASAWGCC